MHADTEQVIERPGDLTAAWLATAIGAGPIADFSVERIGTGQMSECYRVRLSYADDAEHPKGPRQAGVGGAQGRGHRPGESANRGGSGPLRARGPLLRRHSATPGRTDRALLPRRGRHLDGRVRSTAGRRRTRRSSATKSRAPQSNRRTSVSSSWGGCTVRCSATPRWPKRRG